MAEVKKPITVITRVRPQVDSDGADGLDSVSVNDRQVVVSDKGSVRTFESDLAYDRNCTNQQLYNDQIEPLLQPLLQGNHVFVIAYGAVRTGKSYTFFGNSESEGIIDQASDGLFQQLEARANSSKAFVTVSVYDVYNSMIIDLLNPNTKTGLNLLEHRAFGSYIENLCELECVNSNEMKSYIKQAMAVHQVLELRMTNQLGKPHTCVDIHVELIDNDSPSTIKYSTLRFCSPAGAGSIALKFNAGLQSLNKVIDNLAAEKEAWNIPYATSRLTRILETGLGGNARTVWITTIDPIDKNVTDSYHALEVGEKIRRVKNSIRVNKNTISSTIRDLREAIKVARGKLQLTQPGTYMHDIDPQQLKNLKQLISELERIKSQTWDKKHERSIQFNEQRRISLEQEGLLYTLTQATDIDIPQQMIQQSKMLLSSIVTQKSLCDDCEAELVEKRNLFKMRLEAVQKKFSEGSSSSSSAQPSMQDILKSDDKLMKLEKGMLDSEDKFKLNSLELVKHEDEYRKLLTKISTIEAKQRKVFLMGKDAAGLERLNKAQEWSVMKREVDDDKNLASVLSMIASNTEQQKQVLQSTNDANSLRTSAIQTMESLRDTTEQLKRTECERDLLWSRLIERQFKHEVNMTRYQEHMFFIFRNYRSHFEEQKERMEVRYRELLENAVKDALKLSEENQKLKAQLDARLKAI